MKQVFLLCLHDSFRRKFNRIKIWIINQKTDVFFIQIIHAFTAVKMIPSISQFAKISLGKNL